ncbi:glutamine synthetase, partial [Gluconacetobacter tumulisoli]|nr:glutamine synthetase [Gluconacetobacter tumulisoli]
MAKKAPTPAPAAPSSPDAASVAKVFSLIQEHSVELVDLRFTDPRGKWHHTT